MLNLWHRLVFQCVYFSRNITNFISKYSGLGNGDYRTNGEMRLLEHLAARVDLFLDVGYNKGDISNIAYKLNPLISILGFDPNPNIYSDKHTLYNYTIMQFLISPEKPL